MERLGSLDAVFLSIESPECPMNVGSVGIFEGPAPDIHAVRSSIRSRLGSVPRCRQRVRTVAWNLARPVWIDDTQFDIGAHVHEAAVSSEPRALEHFAEELMMRPLDRARALWEVWMVTGLPDGRWALVAKTHHCMVDGISGTDLLSVMMDTSADAPPDRGELSGMWAPAPMPDRIDVARCVTVAMVRSTVHRIRSIGRALAHPASTVRRGRAVAAGARALWLQPRRPPSPLTGAIGPHRRWVHTQFSLADVDATRRAAGATVNDVALTAIALGFRALLMSRHAAVIGRDVMALVPVSTRDPGDAGTPDNRVAVAHAQLPVDIEDPVDALAAVHAHLREVKASHETAASTLLLHSGDLLPHLLAALVARGVVRAQQNLETIATNVPGPRTPLFLAGRRMLASYPFAPIAGRIQIAVAVWSYCGTVYVGVTGDGDGAGDIDELAGGIDRACSALAARAER